MSPDSDKTTSQWCSAERSPLGALIMGGLIMEVKLIDTFYRHTGKEWGFELTGEGSRLIAQHKGDDNLHDAVTRHLWPRIASASVDWNSLLGGAKGWSQWSG